MIVEAEVEFFQIAMQMRFANRVVNAANPASQGAVLGFAADVGSQRPSVRNAQLSYDLSGRSLSVSGPFWRAGLGTVRRTAEAGEFR
jgi:hypothetical protein